MLFAACHDPVKPRLGDIQERIFSPRCTFSSCHSSGGREGSLVLEKGQSFAQLAGVPAVQETAAREALQRVAPGTPAQSFLVIKLRKGMPSKYGKHMPNTGDQLDDDEVAAIEEWVRRGAADD